MALLTSLETTSNAVDAGVGDIAGTEFRRSMSFQIDADATITSVELYLQDGTTPPSDDITIRIETDNAGVPSGTLADANATATISAASVPSSFDWVEGTFGSAFSLSGSTTYHIVASVPDQSTNVNFQWRTDADEGYADGTLSTSQNGGAWSNNSLDGLFKVNGTEAGGVGSLYYQQI